MAQVNGQWKVALAGETGVNFTTFGEDVHGELYGAGYANGTLFKLIVH